MASWIDEFINQYKESAASLWSATAMKVAIADALFYGISALLMLGISAFAANMQASIQAAAIDLTDKGAVTSVLTKMILMMVLMTLGIFAVWVISRAFIWATILRKKLSVKTVLIVAGSYLAWFVIWGIPFYLSFRWLYANVQAYQIPGKGYYAVMYLLIALLFYFNYLFAYDLATKQQVFRSIGRAFATGIRHTKQLILPFLAASITIIIAGLVARGSEAIFPKAMSYVVGGILFFASFTFAKLYYARVLEKMGQSHHHKIKYPLVH